MNLNSISRFVGMEPLLNLEALSATWLQNFAVVPLRHLQLEKLIEQRFDIGCLDRISSMKEHMVFAFDEVARGQVTCGATCCHCPSRATTAPMSAPPIRTVNLFLRVMRNVKGLTPVLSQCRVIAGSDCCMITLAMCCLFSVVRVLTKYFRRSRKIPSTFDLKACSGH